MNLWKRTRYALITALLVTAIFPAFSTRVHADEANAPTVSVQTTEPTSSLQPEPQKKPRHWIIMPAIGTYLPTSSKTKDRFGSSWPNIGFVMGMGVQDRIYDKLAIHIDGITRKSGDNHAYMFPLGVIYTTRSISPKPFSTWFGGSADVYIMNIRSIEDSVDTGWKMSGVGGSVFAGVDISNHVSIKASYLVTPKTEGLDLSGTNLIATIAF